MHNYIYITCWGREIIKKAILNFANLLIMFIYSFIYFTYLFSKIKNATISFLDILILLIRPNFAKYFM